MIETMFLLVSEWVVFVLWAGFLTWTVIEIFKTVFKGGGE